MNPKAQLALFQLLSGLFGWVWIGAGISALVMAAFAMFGEWSWWNVLYALVVSGIGRWLAKGFLDHQKRVAIEMDLVAKGMPLKEARDAWFKAYTGASASPATARSPSYSPSVKKNREHAEERGQIIGDYGGRLEQSAREGDVFVWDVKCLPHDKETILDAICLEIVRADTEKHVEALTTGALFLANYQSEVGDRPISLGVDISSKDPVSLTDDELMALATQIASDADRERFETYRAIVEQDLTRIREKLLAADQLRRAMPEELRRDVLG